MYVSFHETDIFQEVGGGFSSLDFVYHDTEKSGEQ